MSGLFDRFSKSWSQFLLGNMHMSDIPCAGDIILRKGQEEEGNYP